MLMFIQKAEWYFIGQMKILAPKEVLCLGIENMASTRGQKVPLFQAVVFFQVIIWYCSIRKEVPFWPAWYGKGSDLFYGEYVL